MSLLIISCWIDRAFDYLCLCSASGTATSVTHAVVVVAWNIHLTRITQMIFNCQLPWSKIGLKVQSLVAR